MIVDIGARVTNLIMFKDGIMKHMATTHLGGDDLTSAIASSVNVSFELAEEIKQSYAQAVQADIGQDEEVLVKKDGRYIPIKKDQISNAIQPKIGELVQFIRNEVDEFCVRDADDFTIAMVGGGALLSGLIERVSQVVPCKVALGANEQYAQKNLTNSPKYYSAIGLDTEWI